MQGTPADIDLSQIKSRLESIPGVENIHHIHVWSLNENELLELHALINCQTLNEMDQLRDQINKLLRNEFQINHTTINLRVKIQNYQYLINNRSLVGLFGNLILKIVNRESNKILVLMSFGGEKPMKKLPSL